MDQWDIEIDHKDYAIVGIVINKGFIKVSQEKYFESNQKHYCTKH